MSVLLDTSALLALLWGEPGAEAVERALGEGVVTAVNLAELYTKLSDRGGDEAACRAVVSALGLPVLEVGAEAATRAGLMRAATRGRGLSVGDRICLAMGESDEVDRIVTADRAWAELGLDVEIEVIR